MRTELFTILANSYHDRTYNVEVYELNALPYDPPIGEGDGLTLSEAMSEAFKNLDLPEAIYQAS